jgi:transaldolase
MVIARKVYKFVHDRGYQLGFIGGGVRGLQHFTEMVGGDVCITMNWGGQADKLLELDQPVVSRLFNPVQPHVLDELLTKVPQFRQAYMQDGLEVDEYEEYGPVEYFRSMFIRLGEHLKGDQRRRAGRSMPVGAGPVPAYPGEQTGGCLHETWTMNR